MRGRPRTAAIVPRMRDAMMTADRDAMMIAGRGATIPGDREDRGGRGDPGLAERAAAWDHPTVLLPHPEPAASDDLGHALSIHRRMDRGNQRRDVQWEE